MTKPENSIAAAGAHDETFDEALDEVATKWFVRMSSELATEADRCAFRAWFESDATHRAAYARARALWDELIDLPDRRRLDAPQAAARAGAARGVAATGVAARRLARPRSVGRFAMIAACLLLVAGLGLWSLGGYDRARADYATAVGEIRQVTLGDGSVLHLNTDTAVGIDFAGDRRRVLLYRGEAYFAVAPDSRRPFEVATTFGIAHAVGTSFNVRSEEAAMTVAVAEGRVQVGRAGEGAAEGGSITLGPGESLHYTADGRAVRIAAAVDTITAWRQGKLVFANRPLRAVVNELDRYRRGTILILGTKIADERFSGVVSLADTDRALAAIESALPVEVIRLTGYLTLLRGRE